jgi:hypothetical protein
MASKIQSWLAEENAKVQQVRDSEDKLDSGFNEEIQRVLNAAHELDGKPCAQLDDVPFGYRRTAPPQLAIGSVSAMFEFGSDRRSLLVKIVDGRQGSLHIIEELNWSATLGRPRAGSGAIYWRSVEDLQKSPTPKDAEDVVIEVATRLVRAAQSEGKTRPGFQTQVK